MDSPSSDCANHWTVLGNVSLDSAGKRACRIGMRDPTSVDADAASGSDCLGYWLLPDWTMTWEKCGGLESFEDGKRVECSLAVFIEEGRWDERACIPCVDVDGDESIAGDYHVVVEEESTVACCVSRDGQDSRVTRHIKHLSVVIGRYLEDGWCTCHAVPQHVGYGPQDPGTPYGGLRW
jgi:hypothetical protein